MTTRPDLSIIIVNWNSREFLRKCLCSIREQTYGINYEIIVVDNASFDGCRDLLRTAFRDVRFIQSETNLGFAGANDLAAECATGRNLLFLNPDTEILGTALPTLVAFADSRPDAAIVGPKLLNADLTVQMDSVKAFPSLLNQFLDAHLLKMRFPRLSIWGMEPLYSNSDEPAVVDVISGACLLIKREVFESVGRFSTEYFMYSEDVDLCFRIKEAGWNAYIVPRAQVLHYGGQSSALKPVSQFTAVLMRESRFLFFRGTHGKLYAFAFRVITAVNAISRLVLLILIIPFVWITRSSLILQALRKWTKILRWSLGFEQWVKTLA